MKKFLFMPSVLFLIVWSVTFCLYELGLTSNLTALSTAAMLFFLMNMVVGVVTTLMFTPAVLRRLGAAQDPGRSFIENRTVIGLFFVWLLMLVPDIIYSGGIPLIMTMQGSANYTQFGIPTYHGFVNLIFFLLFPSVYISWMRTKQGKFIFILLVMTVWEIVALRRGILMGGLVELFVVYAYYARISVRSFVLLVFLGIFVVVGFGYVGDLRGVDNPYAYLWVGGDGNILSLLPSGFTWFYVYVTAGMSNLFYNVSDIIPSYDLTSFSDIFPSVVRGVLFPDIGFHDQMSLVDENANVSTMYELLLPDLGFLSVMVVFVMLCLFNLSYVQFLNGKRFLAFSYLIAMQCVAFSIFYNLFFIQTYMLLFFAAMFFGFLSGRRFQG